MCDPLTIAGVVLTGASAAANSAAQSSVARARDDAMEAERIRQGALDQEAAAHNLKAQEQYQDAGKKQAERGKELADYFTTQQSVPADETGPVALPQSSSNITVAAEGKARERAKAFTDKTGAALGDLRSFGDLFADFGRGTAREAGYVGQIGGFKKGSSAVLPYELEAASSKGGGMRTLGDVLGGLGKIGIGAGLSGASLFGAPASSANFVSNSASPFAYGSGGYTGAGPFMNPGKSGLFSLFG